MAQLDKAIAALIEKNADELALGSDETIALVRGTQRQPGGQTTYKRDQVLTLIAEIAPEASKAAVLRGDMPAKFTYLHPGTGKSCVVRLMVDGAKVRASIVVAPDAAARAGAEAAAAAPSLAAEPSVAPKPPVEIALASPLEQPMGGWATAPTDCITAIEALLRKQTEVGAADLHLRTGEPPIVRLHGEMQRIGNCGPMSHEMLKALITSIMPDRNRVEYAETWDTDFAYEIAGVARFRANAFVDRNGAGAVLRVIPSKIVTVEEMGISKEVQQLCYLSKGLVLVTGPTGSGKSTTLSAMIDLINRTRADHIITIEDPIEFVHPNKRCLITQRQVGVHTQSFKTALRAALREDPDIVLVGELRDLETVAIAIETAETGHLVFGTLHTTTAAGTVDRVIQQFPASEQDQIRQMLATSLKGVIAQNLCKKIGGGRVAAREVLLGTSAISNLIREGKTFQIPSAMQVGKKLGMMMLNDSLMELVQSGKVAPEEAYMKCADKPDLVAKLGQAGFPIDVANLDPSSAG